MTSELPDRGFDPPHALANALHRGGVADPNMVVRAEGDAWHDRDSRLLQQKLGERVRIANRSLAIQPFDFGKEIERSVGIAAAHPIDLIDRWNEPCAPLRIRRVHFFDFRMFAGK